MAGPGCRYRMGLRVCVLVVVLLLVWFEWSCYQCCCAVVIRLCTQWVAAVASVVAGTGVWIVLLGIGGSSVPVPVPVPGAIVVSLWSSMFFLVFTTAVPDDVDTEGTSMIHACLYVVTSWKALPLRLKCHTRCWRRRNSNPTLRMMRVKVRTAIVVAWCLVFCGAMPPVDLRARVRAVCLVRCAMLLCCSFDIQ